MKFYGDFETHSTTHIRRGADAYLNQATPLIFCYALDDGPVNVIDYTENPVLKLPFELFDPSYTLVFHNVMFDRFVLNRCFDVDLPIERFHCTMAQASLHSLPGGLGALCEVLDVPLDSAKDADGKRLIRKFCGPKPLVKDDEWPLFIDYARRDVEAMRACFKKMPNWNYAGHEKRVWGVDQEINSRGFKIDSQFAQNAVEALIAEKKRLNQQTFELTDEAVGAATQRDKLLLYLLEVQGVHLKDLRAATIEAALEFDNLHAGTKELLRVRLQSAKASPSKYKRVLECKGADDRLRGTLQYAGANRTARWAGRMFQPQNLLRPTMNKHDIRGAIELIRTGNAEAAKMFGPMNELCANGARGIIVAPDGYVLQGADYSSIEGRGNAWIAGEEWKLAAFRDPTIDMYCLIYEKSFDLPSGSVAKKGDYRRQHGKVMELALGFQGGVGAFVNMAAAYDMDLLELGEVVKPTREAENNYEFALSNRRDYNLSPKVWIACETLKLGYRKANPALVQFWNDIESACRAAIFSHKKIQVGLLVVDANSDWLRIKLPSGRFLCYALPRVSNGKISYMAWRNRRWVRITTYGGKLDENIVQALSRDILAAALVRLADAGYPLVLHVHDEAVAEVKDRPLSEFVRIMTEDPGWAQGFPIAAEGFELRRYEKT